MNCFCGTQHFIIHKNALSLTSRKQYFHIFHKDLKLGYSIHECVNCHRLFICRDNLDDHVDKFIPVEIFNDKDVEDLITRSSILFDLQHYTKEFVSNMKAKR